MRVRNVKRAFTLIEILIVVVILGILAAIVIPQFTDASEQAQEANLRSQLQTIRGQIELHNVQQTPDIYDDATALADFWDALVDLDYLQSPPRNPLQDNETSVAAAPADGIGWVWAEKQGLSETFALYAVGADGDYFDEDGDGVTTDEGPDGVPN